GQTGLISPLQSDESVRYGSRNVARTLACEYDCTPTGSIALLTNVIDLHPGVAKSVSRSASFHCDGRWDCLLDHPGDRADGPLPRIWPDGHHHDRSRQCRSLGHVADDQMFRGPDIAG